MAVHVAPAFALGHRGGMEDEQPEREVELTPDGDIFGSPRKFSYPKPAPISADDQAKYDEIHEQIIEMLSRQKKSRRSRWRAS